MLWRFDRKWKGLKNFINAEEKSSHLSNEGSLLNISVGTVGGAFSGTNSRYVWRDSKCLSTSSGVMCPSDIKGIGIMLFEDCTWDINIQQFYESGLWIYDMKHNTRTYYRCVASFSNFWRALFLFTGIKWFCDHRRMMRSMIIDIHVGFLSKSWTWLTIISNISFI